MKPTPGLIAAVLLAATASISDTALARPSGASGRGASVHGDGFRHWNGSRHGHWRPRWHANWSFYYGIPLFLGTAWAWPYYADFGDYPRGGLIYREMERAPGIYREADPAPTTEAPRTEGAPTQVPLYRNYCASAKAYYPKVTACPEGWSLATPAN